MSLIIFRLPEVVAVVEVGHRVVCGIMESVIVIALRSPHYGLLLSVFHLQWIIQ